MSAPRPYQFKGRRTYIGCGVLALYSLSNLFGIVPDGGLFVTGQSGAITSALGAVIGATLRVALANMLYEFRERQMRIEAKLDRLFPAEEQPNG